MRGDESEDGMGKMKKVERPNSGHRCLKGGGKGYLLENNNRVVF